MNDMGTRQTVTSHLQHVPDEPLDEILDFIDFVAARPGHTGRDAEFDSLQDSSAIAVWNNSEDEVWNCPSMVAPATSRTFPNG